MEWNLCITIHQKVNKCEFMQNTHITNRSRVLWPYVQCCYEDNDYFPYATDTIPTQSMYALKLRTLYMFFWTRISTGSGIPIAQGS